MFHLYSTTTSIIADTRSTAVYLVVSIHSSKDYALAFAAARSDHLLDQDTVLSMAASYLDTPV